MWTNGNQPPPSKRTRVFRWPWALLLTATLAFVFAAPVSASPGILKLLREAKGLVEKGSFGQASSKLERALKLLKTGGCDACLVGLFKGVEKYKLGRAGRYFKMKLEFTNNTPAATGACVLHTQIYNKSGKRIADADVQVPALARNASTSVVTEVVRQTLSQVGRIDFSFSAVCPSSNYPPRPAKL